MRTSKADSRQLTITKAGLAAKLGCSERYVYGVLRTGTTSYELAERIARLGGGQPKDYMRVPQRRGRRRPFPFREFCLECGEKVELSMRGDERDAAYLAIHRFMSVYNSKAGRGSRST